MNSPVTTQYKNKILLFKSLFLESRKCFHEAENCEVRFHDVLKDKNVIKETRSSCSELQAKVAKSTTEGLLNNNSYKDIIADILQNPNKPLQSVKFLQ
ncbi:MAG: hypothetical protein WCJ84_05780 [Candidatus Peregrinibacteria bacterium]